MEPVRSAIYSGAQPVEKQQSNPLARFFRYILSGPAVIRNTLLAQGLGAASMAALLYSVVLSGLLFAGASLFFCSLFILIAAMVSLDASQSLQSFLQNELVVILAVPLALIALVMLLSDLAAIALSLFGLVLDSENRLKAAAALLLGTFLLAFYGLITFGAIALGG